MMLALLFSVVAHAQPLCSTNYSISPTDWIADIDEINRCRPLTNPGDARVFDVTRGSMVRAAHRQENVSHGNIQSENYKLPNDHKGTLKYLGEKQYEMVFNLNFTANPDATVTPAAMLDRVRSCLDAARPGLRGPGGEQLNLIAVSPAQANRMGDVKPPKIDITIIKPGERGDAQRYSSSFNCATIVHELLHFAGLCDEYLDNGDDVNASDCRAMGPGDSVMGEGMQIAFDDSVGEFARCELPTDSPVLRHLQSPNPVVREIAMRKKYYQIGNFSSLSVGLPLRYPPVSPVVIPTVPVIPGIAGAPPAVVAEPPKALTLKDIYCTEVDAEPVPIPTSVDVPFNRLLVNTPEAIELESYLRPSLSESGNASIVGRKILQCRCPAGDQACRQYLDLMRPEAIAISSPQRKVYTCPEFNGRQPPSDFTIPPGEFRVAGTTVHYRNKPMGRTMLHPAHFARIINGPCQIASTPESVKRYNECARFSVKSSIEELGDDACAQRPAFCDQPESWLGTLPTVTSP
jgi:hypothetical protein